MITKLIARFVCISIIWVTVYPTYASPQPMPEQMDETSIKVLYPNARVIHVSAEDYPELQTKLRLSGYQPQTETNTPLLALNQPVQTTEDMPVSASTDDDECRGRSDSDYSQDESADNSVGINLDFLNGRGGGNSDDAAVLFVIVGAIVLVVWTIYAIKYLYDVTSGIEVCGKRWSEWTFSRSEMNTDNTQYAHFSGVRYITGVDRGTSNIGLSAELGQADVSLTESGSLRLQGMYWLLGPMLRWSLPASRYQSYFQMDFVAGSTEHEEMGIIAAARMGFNFGLNDQLRFGINYGALNINLHEQGIILDRTQFYTFWGLELGFRY